MKKKLKIGYISYSDPMNRREWSGTHYSLVNNLSKIDNIEVITQRFRFTPTLYTRLFCSIMKRWYKSRGKNRSFAHFKLLAKSAAKTIPQSFLDEVDVIFAAELSSALAFVKTDKPLIYFSDTTFDSIYNYYIDWSNFSKKNYREGRAIEQKALSRATHIIYPSDWAKNSAILDYGVNEEKISVVELGTNFDDEDIPRDENRALDKTKSLKMAFFCVKWDQKGGDIAVDTVNALNAMGIAATLELIGIDAPEKHKNNPFVVQHGFFDKNNADEAKHMEKVVRACDILLLPTLAECAGIVFCEVSAYGMPIFTYDTGGIPNYVVHGKNGYRLDMSARGKDFAQQIKESLYDKDEYEKLRDGCYDMFENRLNWRIWRAKVSAILDGFRS